MNDQKWTSEYLQMVEDCEAREDRLTDWERDFISSIKYRLENEFSISQKQLETIDRIWDKATKQG